MYMNSVLIFKISFVVMVSLLSGVFFIQANNQDVFAFEENILALQSGIISTSNQDYALSQEFEAKIFQDGKIMRLSGLTTTGEQYYLYQMIVDGDTIVRGKIYSNNAFIPIIFKKDLLTQQIQHVDTNLAMTVKLSSYTYSNYPFVISVKVFDASKNSQPRFDSRIGILKDVFVDVTITDKLGNYVTNINGYSDSTGVFNGKYLVLENVVNQGKYNVEVVIEKDNAKTSESFTTFFRGDIRDYFHDTN